MGKLKLKIHNEALKARYGDEIEVNATKSGVPRDRYWRNRLRDAKIDNCVEIVKSGAAAPKKSRGDS